MNGTVPVSVFVIEDISAFFSRDRDFYWDSHRDTDRSKALIMNSVYLHRDIHRDIHRDSDRDSDRDTDRSKAILSSNFLPFH